MVKKTFFTLLVGTLGTLLPTAAAPPASLAFELYSWTVAENFCELRSFGMERKEAITSAAELVFNRNPFMRVDFLIDTAVIIKDKETLAVARIRREAERRCPKLARRDDPEEGEKAADKAADKVIPPAGGEPGATP